MPALPELRPDTKITYSNWTADNTYTQVADESDDTFNRSVASSGWIEYSLTNTPSDFLSMDTASIKIRASTNTSDGDDSLSVRAFLRYSDGSTAGGEQSHILLPLSTTPVEYTFTIDTASMGARNIKTDWDDIRIVFDVVYSNNMGSDNNAVRVYRAGVTGTYTSSVITSTKTHNIDAAISKTKSKLHTVDALTLVAPQYLRPELIVVRNNWTGDAGETTNLENKINEVSPGNDADYIVGVP